MKKHDVAYLLTYGFVFWILFVYISTLILSYFSALTRFNIFVANFVFFFFVALQFINWTLHLPKKKSSYLIVIILALLLTQGILSAPNTTDSQVYHLPRIFYWAQSESVIQSSTFTSHDYMPPLGEYIFLHIYLIFNSDRLLFLGQWTAFISTILISGMISDLFFKKSTVIKSIIQFSVASLPMAVMQAASTQVDLMLAYLLLFSCFLAFKIYLRKAEYQSYDFILLSITIALGFLIKSTFIYWSLIPVAVVSYRLIQQPSFNQKNIQIFLLSTLLFTSLVVPFLIQNLYLYGNLITDTQGHSFFNGEHSFLLGLSAIVKNIFLHIPVPFLNQEITYFLETIHLRAGIDIQEPKNMWFSEKFIIHPFIIPHEDLVGNPLQLLVFIFSLVLSVRKKDLFQIKLIRFLIISMIIVFILFSVTLKWQPWHSRLHLPLFELATIIGVGILAKYYTNFAKAITFMSIIAAFSLIALNFSRPYIPYNAIPFIAQLSANTAQKVPKAFYQISRDEQFFNARPYWFDPYSLSSDFIADNNTIHSLSVRFMDNFEYPFLRMIHKKRPDIIVVKNDHPSTDALFYTASVPYDLQNQHCIRTSDQYGYACVVIKKPL